LRLTDKAYGFSFYLWEMQLVIRNYVETSSGFRGVAASIKIFSCYFGINSMSYTSVRRWLLCYGYYLLVKPQPKRTGDWVFINDFSIQLGKEKCLLILGASLAQMRKKGFNLSHKDVAVLDIFVTSQANYKLVKERLDMVTNRVGIPAQIVSDHGSDIKTGNELFCQQHPTVVYTYDISHKIGCLLKALLESDCLWQCLLKDINVTLQQVQQTELSFLRPILPRKKSRYLNISLIINWVTNILSYQNNNDFSLIASGYMIHPESIYKITTSIADKNSVNSLIKMTNKKFATKEDVVAELSLILQQGIAEQQIMIIDLSGKRFYEKFGLFEQYRELIGDLSSMIEIIEKIQKIVKHQGLSIKTMEEIDNEIDLQQLRGNRTTSIYYQIINYLNEELSKFGNTTKAYLASSDIEESLFGKYKYKLAERMGGIYESILILAVLCSDYNLEDIKAASEMYNMQHVNNFIRPMIGKSIQSKQFF
jgi:hypothetical protein